jgi:hypothetical protein
MNPLSRDVGQHALAAAPPVTVSALAVAGGIGLQGWVFVLTLVYLAVQIVYLLWKWRREATARKVAP